MKNNFLEFKLCDELTSCISIFSNMETKVIEFFLLK